MDLSSVFLLGSAMQSELGARIEQRIQELGTNSRQVEKASGLSIGFIRDLIEGRKKDATLGNLEKVANVLDCDIEFLAGIQKTPRRKGGNHFPLQFLGTCEAAWRDKVGGPQPSAPPTLGPDPRYPLENQGFYDVRDNHAAGFGIPEDSIVVAYTGAQVDKLRDGDIATISRENGELRQTLIVKIKQENGKIIPLRSNSEDPEIADNWNLEALIAYTVRIFN